MKIDFEKYGFKKSYGEHEKERRIEDEKKEKYSPLAEKIRSIYKVKTETIPIVIGALGTVPKRLPGFLHDLGVPDVIGCMQTCALLGSQRILKNTLSI